MIKVSQTIHAPYSGDCLAACIASILECDLAKLPNPQGDNWWMEWCDFLSKHGVRLLGKGRSLYYWESYWIGVLPSLNFPGRTHAVVMFNDSLVHDPNTPPANLYPDTTTYEQCTDGYVMTLSDAGLYRRSSLYA